MTKTFWMAIGLFAVGLLAQGCASTQPVKTQAYAELRHQKTLESDLPVVWKALEAAMDNYKIIDRSPGGDLKTDKDWQDVERRTLKTDWIYGLSRDKYVEFKVNDFPRKQYLQTRFRFRVEAKRVMGGTQLTVDMDEQIEKLEASGKSAGYDDVEHPDSSRANGLIEKVEQSILSAPPTGDAN